MYSALDGGRPTRAVPQRTASAMPTKSKGKRLAQGGHGPQAETKPHKQNSRTEITEYKNIVLVYTCIAQSALNID